MQTLFPTTPTAQPTAPPTADDESTTTTEETKTDDESATSTEETTQEQAIVRLPDGTEMPADTYVKAQLAEETSKISTQWEKIHEATLAQSGQTETETEKPSWLVDIDDDNFQSDAEKALAQGHNALGEEVQRVGTLLEKVSDQLTEVNATTSEAQAQRQIDEIVRTKGVSEQELKDIYNEYGGEVKNLDMIAEVALSRKASAEESEGKTKGAADERRTQTSMISGGGNAGTTDAGGDQTPGRGLDGKDIYNGAAIATKYKAW